MLSPLSALSLLLSSFARLDQPIDEPLGEDSLVSLGTGISQKSSDAVIVIMKTGWIWPLAGGAAAPGGHSPPPR